jgi:hypothetical protein
MLFPFQRDIATWALRRGKSAVFAHTGLGKGPIQMEWCNHVSRKRRICCVSVGDVGRSCPGPLAATSPAAASWQPRRSAGSDATLREHVLRVLRTASGVRRTPAPAAAGIRAATTASRAQQRPGRRRWRWRRRRDGRRCRHRSCAHRLLKRRQAAALPRRIVHFASTVQRASAPASGRHATHGSGRGAASQSGPAAHATRARDTRARPAADGEPGTAAACRSSWCCCGAYGALQYDDLQSQRRQSQRRASLRARRLRVKGGCSSSIMR